MQKSRALTDACKAVARPRNDTVYCDVPRLEQLIAQALSSVLTVLHKPAMIHRVKTVARPRNDTVYYGVPRLEQLPKH